MRRLFTSILLLCATLAVATPSKPVVYDVTALVAGTRGAISLLGGKQVEIAQRWSAEKILFSDLMPGANWEHPASFQVVAPNGEVLEKIHVTRPPMGLETAPIVSGGDIAMPKGGIKYALDPFGGKFRVQNPEKYYAVLINGRADLRHWNDFSFLYRVLTQIYGYPKENITVVDGVYKDRQPDLDEDGVKDIQYSSTKAGLTEAMQMLAQKLKPTDQLLLAVNDHGGSTAGQSTIILYDGEITVGDFAKLFQGLKAGRILSLYEQCYSGGFVRPSTAMHKVSMSAATDKEYSWASSDLNWDEWIYHVIAAFAMQTHDGRKLDVDGNRDGKVSAQEAFSYSVAQDKAAESPLMEAHQNSGNAAGIGLGF